MCMFVSLCDFVYSFAFTICPRVLSVRFFFGFFLYSLGACYNWWICFLVWLFSSFLFLLLYNFFYF